MTLFAYFALVVLATLFICMLFGLVLSSCALSIASAFMTETDEP